MKKNILSLIIGLLLGSAMLAGAVGPVPFENVQINNQGELRWREGNSNGTNYISVRAPSAVTSNVLCTLENDSTPFDSCVSATGTIDGSGTTNRVAKWQDSNTLTNSLFSDDGTNLTLTSGELRLPIPTSLDPFDPIAFIDLTDGSISTYTDGSGNGLTIDTTPSDDFTTMYLWGTDGLTQFDVRGTEADGGAEIFMKNSDGDGFSFAAYGPSFTGTPGSWSRTASVSILRSDQPLNIGTTGNDPIKFYVSDGIATGLDVEIVTGRTSIYDLFTDSSNYERYSLNVGSDTLSIAAETLGTGADDLTINLLPAGTGTVGISGNSTQAATFRLYEDTDDGSNYTSFKSPALASNVVYVLPPDDGDAGEVLHTDGSGNLTWDTDDSGAGGTITGSLTDGRVTLSSGATAVTDDSALTFDRTDNQLGITGGTTETDNSAQVFSVASTLPASPSVGVDGVLFSITSAGSASQPQVAQGNVLRAGYTGSSETGAFGVVNAAASTGTALNLTSAVNNPQGNAGARLQAFPNSSSWGGSGTAVAGNSYGAWGQAWNSTGTNVGLMGKAAQAVAGNNIGVLGSAANSSEATDLKNVAVYGTLNSSLWSGVNGSFAGVFDGGTLPDANSMILKAIGTFPSSPSGAVTGVHFAVTGSGSASQEQNAAAAGLLAGYTGSSRNYAFIGNNLTASTGTTLNLNGNTVLPVANYGLLGGAIPSSETAGVMIGTAGRAQNSTTQNFGLFGSATDGDTAGSNIAVFGNASGSTEGTDLKNVAVYGTLNSSLITGLNRNIAGLFDGGTAIADANTQALRVVGTTSGSQTGSMALSVIALTSAGSASFEQDAEVAFIGAGYTGSSTTRSLRGQNTAAGTGTTLRVGDVTGGGTSFNMGVMGDTTASTTGANVGVHGYATNSSAQNIGGYFRATDSPAGTNIAVLGSARNSTEGTDFKDVGGYFTTRSSLTTGVNVSVALIAENGSTEDIFRAYDAGTLVFQITDGGGLKTTGGATGVTASGASCTITAITNGLITGGSCV